LNHFRVIEVAAGRQPADLLLRGARVVNVFSGEIQHSNVALVDGAIAGVGDYRQAKEEINLEGQYILPGFIDGHIHIESTMLTPEGFAEAALAHGTTAVVADPHEIVNVCGLDGFRYMVEAFQGLPLDAYFTVPSCVPATPMETSGSSVGGEEIREAFKIHPSSPALGEMMNYPGVIHGDSKVLEIMRASLEFTPLIDGHAPTLRGKELMAYAAAGMSTDHESISAEEAREKLCLGLRIAIREGSAARNLKDLLPVVNQLNHENFFFCCDDRHPGDLVDEGGVAAILRKAVSSLDPVVAVKLATINPARHYRLDRRGGIAPGYRADLVVVNNLKDFQAKLVIKDGTLVARDGRYLGNIPRREDQRVKNTVSLPHLGDKLELKLSESKRRVRVIEVVPGQIFTRQKLMDAREAAADEDVNLAAVVERHGKNGNVSPCLVKGFGALQGALASTVAHDSHNLILVGRSPHEMEQAARAVTDSGGGLAVVKEDRTLCRLPLPVAGLMSDRSAVKVSELHEKLQEASREIGCLLEEPFMTMSFLALPVIPELKITDRGLVDVQSFSLVGLWLDET